MITLSFSQLGRYGRLGNQLFQLAGTLGLAEKRGMTAAFPAWEYEKYFDISLPHGDLHPDQVKERFFHHHEWDIPEGGGDLLGYLQSEKYFGSTRLALKKVFVRECKAKFPEPFQRETILIQVRRGDYVGNPNYYQLPPTFYLDALLAYFPDWQSYNLLFVSDDIEYCKTSFEGLPNAYFSTGNTDIQDLALASACDHFIISNSSFGWWCAWLGEKPHSRIIHSGHMYAGKLARNNINDYRPARWTEYRRETYKIPLPDLTFTIPVYYDHDHRKQNLDLVLYMLMSTLDTNFIVCEWGGDKFRYTAAWGTYMTLDDAPYFHRTRMLNQMAEAAQTPYIANWDADVIIPPAQILAAVEALRAGADMVYPYDGGFARMRREDWWAKIQGARDIGIVRDTPFRHRAASHNSVGGAVMWNKESFVDGGMENQNFISFGPEDCERHDRFKALGYNIRRTRGALFHMDHFVGPNSSPKNPHFKHNTEEIEKIRSLCPNRQALRAYIDTWDWRHIYTARYYRDISEGSIRSARIVMQALAVIGVKPESIIDIGCGVGEWNNGHPDYTGVDHHVQMNDLLISSERLIECDLNREDVDLGRKFDLALCLEVAEHLKPARAEGLVKMLCNLSDRVLFSAAIPHQGGTGHVNEAWQSWWAELFRAEGFGAAARQPDIEDCEEVEFWYRQNIVLYERGARGQVQDFVLPAYYVQIVEALRR
jgi:SAM-dependent methyltransferase